MASIMATGYVHRMLDNKFDFEQFVLHCAMAFVSRDSADAPPESFEPDQYYINARREAEQEIDRLSGLGATETAMLGRQMKDEMLASFRKSQAKRNDEIATVRQMMERVEAWKPPTDNHIKLREFMLEQLGQSVKFEGDDFYTESIAKLAAKTPESFVSDKIAELHDSISRHIKEHEKELEYCRKRNEYVRQLRESFSKSKEAI